MNVKRGCHKTYKHTPAYERSDVDIVFGKSCCTSEFSHGFDQLHLIIRRFVQ